MTVRLANEIREVATPIRCAACFNQQPALRHVDFDSACDRGYSDGVATPVSMDELVLCENCVRNGAELLGMTDSVALKAENDELRRKVALKDKLLKQAQRYSDTMEQALGHRPDPVRIDHRKRPRQLREDVVA